MKKATVILVVIVLMLSSGCEKVIENIKAEPKTETTTTEAIGTSETTITTAEAKTSKPTEVDFLVLGPGQYKIGSDAPEGLYLLLPQKGTSGYFAVTSNGSDILINENFAGVAYVRVYEGEYLELSRSTALDANERAPIIDSVVGLEDGTYNVGRDIPPGEYKIAPISNSGYYALIDSRHEIYSNKNFEGAIYVTAEKGQFLQLSRAKIISAP